MQELYRRLGPESEIVGEEANVVCFGRARNTVHASMYLVNGKTWGIESRQFPSVPHICNSGSMRGCVVFSHLLALSNAYQVKAPDTRLNVVTLSQDTARLVRTWRAGDTTLPDWYCPDGTDNAWLNDLALKLATYPKLIRISVAPVDRIKGGTQAWNALQRFEDLSYTAQDRQRQTKIDKVVVPQLTSWQSS